MSLHPPTPRRERILAYGQPGAGKSTTWVQIAEWYYKTKVAAKVWVVDTDICWEAMRPEDGHLDQIVEAFPIYEWSDYKPAIQKIRENAKPDDWFSIDRGDTVWDAAQEGWSQAVEGKDIDEFFLMHQQRGTNPGGDFGTNWVQIKRMYNGVIGLVQRFKGHVIVCASASEVREKKGQFGDDAEVYNKYAKIGWKPNGQDKLAHLFHTELFLADTPSGYRMTTAKERKAPSGGHQRQYVKGKPVTPDFVMAYLIQEAGWKP